MIQDNSKQIRELLKKAKETDDKSEKLKLEKQAKALEPKPKFYFTVNLEAMIPATITYRVLAEDAEQAFELSKKMAPNGVKHRLNGKRDIKLTVLVAGTNLIKFFKNFIK